MRAPGPGPFRCGLAGLVAVAVASGSFGYAAPTASAEGCAWQQHSKRVVKHLKRHGRKRRVNRVKHWWTCVPQQAASAPDPVTPVLPVEEALPVAEAPEEAQAFRLGVKAVEWSYTLSRPEVSAGEVTVELNNQGEDAHNLKLQREGSAEPPLEVPEATADEVTSASFTLAPGTYHLYCSLFHHDEKGMHATLVVGTGTG